MAKRGSKGKPRELKVLQKTNRPCRDADVLAEALSGEPVKPVGLTDGASVVWDREVKLLMARGIDLHGYELMLQILCEEITFVEKEHAKQNDVSTAKINSIRILCNEFYMTPASGLGKVGSGKKENRFSGIGKKKSG